MFLCKFIIVFSILPVIFSFLIFNFLLYLLLKFRWCFICSECFEIWFFLLVFTIIFFLYFYKFWLLIFFVNSTIPVYGDNEFDEMLQVDDTPDECLMKSVSDDEAVTTITETEADENVPKLLGMIFYLNSKFLHCFFTESQILNYKKIWCNGTRQMFQGLFNSFSFSRCIIFNSSQLISFSQFSDRKRQKNPFIFLNLILPQLPLLKLVLYGVKVCVTTGTKL